MTTPTHDDKQRPKQTIGGAIKRFFIDLFREILKELLVLIIVFIVATAIAAGVCLYYGVPLWLSLIGGFITLGVALYLRSASIFD